MITNSIKGRQVQNQALFQKLKWIMTAPLSINPDIQVQSLVPSLWLAEITWWMTKKIYQLHNSVDLIEFPVYQAEILASHNSMLMMNSVLNILWEAIHSTLKVAVEILMFKKRSRSESLKIKLVNKKSQNGDLSTKKPRKYLRRAC